MGYPNTVVSFTTKNAGDTIQPAHVNDVQTEVTAIEAGLLQGTAPLNSSNSTLANLSVPGGSTLAAPTLGSTMTIGTLPYIFPAAGGSVNKVLGVSSTSGSTMTLGWVDPALPTLGSSAVTYVAGDVTNNSTVALADLTGAALTFITGAARVLLGFAGILSNGTNSAQTQVAVNVDGSDATVLLTMQIGGAGADNNCTFTYLTSALSSGSHTFKVRWRPLGGVATMRGSSSQPYTFWGTELH